MLSTPNRVTLRELSYHANICIRVSIHLLELQVQRVLGIEDDVFDSIVGLESVQRPRGVTKNKTAGPV